MPDEPHEFTDFNAKLIVLETLCYDLDVLAPYTGEDDDDIVDDDDERTGPDRKAREYYDDLDVLPEHLALVTAITVDGGLEIQQDVYPEWDGEGDYFDVQDWTDILDLPALESVDVSQPLPPHVDAALRARGVEIVEG